MSEISTIADKVCLEFTVREIANQALDLAGQCKGMISSISNNYIEGGKPGEGYVLRYSRDETSEWPELFTEIYLADPCAERLLVDAICRLSGIISKQ